MTSPARTHVQPSADDEDARAPASSASSASSAAARASGAHAHAHAHPHGLGLGGNGTQADSVPRATLSRAPTNDNLASLDQPGSLVGSLIVLRHGLSIWNADPKDPTKDWRYAGTADVPLSTRGVEEALEAAERMKKYRIDVVFTSRMCRATMTAFLALGKHHDRKPVTWYRDPADWPGKRLFGAGELDTVPMMSTDVLNERCFGELEGVLSSQQVTPERSKEFLKKCRNSYRTAFPGRGGESSHDVFRRVVPFFVREVVPLLLQGRNVLLVTHGFVSRVLTKFLEEMDDAQFEAEMELEKTAPERCRLLAPTGAPLVYKLVNVTRRSFERIANADDADALLTAHQAFSAERVAGDVAYEVAHSEARAV